MSKKKIVILIISIIVITSITLIAYKFMYLNKPTNNNTVENENIQENNFIYTTPAKRELSIFNGTNRIIAVMIDNEQPAWPQAGLQEAYVIYECLVEGGQTRMMALFKNNFNGNKKVGPVRSSRHYFAQYAMEHNSIYTHYGWSPLAQQYITTNKVNNINGITSDGKIFWREGKSYHSAFTKLSNIYELASKKGYALTDLSKPIFNFSVDKYDLINGIDVNNIKIQYSQSHYTSYVYNAEEQVYYRSMRGIKHTDRETKKQYFAKNIIIQKVKNYLLNDGEEKGRQDLEIVGTGQGTYITNGKYISITWKKASLKDKTYYYDSEGKEIILNDGLTFIQVVPLEGTVTLN